MLSQLCTRVSWALQLLTNTASTYMLSCVVLMLAGCASATYLGPSHAPTHDVSTSANAQTRTRITTNTPVRRTRHISSAVSGIFTAAATLLTILGHNNA